MAFARSTNKASRTTRCLTKATRPAPRPGSHVALIFTNRAASAAGFGRVAELNEADDLRAIGWPNTSLHCLRSASRKAEHQMPKMSAQR